MLPDSDKYPSHADNRIHQAKDVRMGPCPYEHENKVPCLRERPDKVPYQYLGHVSLNDSGGGMENSTFTASTTSFPCPFLISWIRTGMEDLTNSLYQTNIHSCSHSCSPSGPSEISKATCPAEKQNVKNKKCFVCPYPRQGSGIDILGDPTENKQQTIVPSPQNPYQILIYAFSLAGQERAGQ